MDYKVLSLHTTIFLILAENDIVLLLYSEGSVYTKVDQYDKFAESEV